ncbi:MAG: hypothetical protein PVG32_01905 [Anaerolineales bacterium]
MTTLMIILRIIHIFAGVFWVGVSIFNVRFLQPAVQSTGKEGQTVMQYLTSQTRFTVTMYTVATLSLLSGLTMYWILFKFRLSALSSGYGLTLTIGGIAGAIAWVLAIFFVRNVINRMQAIGKAVQQQGGPPTAEQGAELQAASVQMVKLGQWGVAFMIVALLGMSIAQYVSI